MKLLVTLIASGLLAVTASAEETYYGLYLRGKKIGYAVSIWDELKVKGKAVYRMEWKEVVAGSFTLSKTDSQSNSVSWADDDGNPIKSISVQKSGGRTVTVTAHYSGRRVSVVMDSSGIKTAKTLILPQGKKFEIDPYLQITEGGATIGKQLELYDLDTTTLSLEKSTVIYRGKVKKAVRDMVMDTERLDVVSHGHTSSLYYDGDGNIVNDEGPLGSAMVREPKAVALALNADPSINVYAAMAIPTDKPLASPGSLETLKVDMTGTKWETASFPSDEHQTATKSANAWTIDIHPPKLNLADETTIAAARVGQEEWLKPDLNIPSDSDQFKSLAATIIGKEVRVGRAILLIKNFVTRTMHPKDGIGGYRNAKEILKTKEGVCRDYAILIVTILRAAGIPSKLAVGLVSWDKDFYYHEWVLAWDSKQWVGVDSVTPAEQLSASHIELATGTFEQSSNYSVIDNPRLAIIASRYRTNDEPADAGVAKPTAAEMGMSKVDPKAQAAMDRGDRLKEIGKYGLAEKAYREAMRLAPKSAKPLLSLAELFDDQSMWAKSEAVYSAILAAWPRNYQALSGAGYCQLSLGQFQEAQLSLVEARRYDPDSTTYPPLLGYVYYWQGDYVDAERQYRLCIQQEPKSVEYRCLLSQTLFQLGRIEESETEARDVLKLAPNSSQAHFLIGAALYSKRRLADSETAFRKSIALAAKADRANLPQLAYVHAALSQTLLDLDRKAEALAQAKTAIKLGLKGHPVFRKLGLNPE